MQEGAAAAVLQRGAVGRKRPVRVAAMPETEAAAGRRRVRDPGQSGTLVNARLRVRACAARGWVNVAGSASRWVRGPEGRGGHGRAAARAARRLQLYPHSCRVLAAISST